MINKNMPLPSHTKLDCNECYAKIVLEEIFSEQFSNMKINDKPDLQNDDLGIGVEVTTSVNSKQLNAESLYVKMQYANDSQKEEIEKEIVKCGAKINGVLCGILENDNFNRIYKALENKLKRLSLGQYKSFSKQYLFIFSEILATQEMREKALKEIQHISSSAIRKFEKIFVHVPGAIYIFDLATNITYEKKNKSNVQFDHAIRARAMVEEAEDK